MKILAVFAHPDDESFGPGGTLCRYALTGHTVDLMTFTRGEAGSLGISKELPDEELAKRRSLELECAARKLHIHNLTILDFPDKKLKELPDDKGTGVIRKKIEEFNPDVVITFHPNGISGHPDHQTVSKWTYETVKGMKKPPRLLFFGLHREQTDSVTHRKIQAMEKSEITHRIDVAEYLHYKIEAIHCHVTQDELWKQFESIPGDYSSYARWEHYSQVIPSLKNGRVREDLFEE